MWHCPFQEGYDTDSFRIALPQSDCALTRDISYPKILLNAIKPSILQRVDIKKKSLILLFWSYGKKIKIRDFLRWFFSSYVVGYWFVFASLLKTKGNPDLFLPNWLCAVLVSAESDSVLTNTAQSHWWKVSKIQNSLTVRRVWQHKKIAFAVLSLLLKGFYIVQQ